MSPTEKLVEKVAEAIHKCAADNVGTETPEWTTECPEVKAQVRLLAKAALSAIPYPKEEEIAWMIEQSFMSPASGPVDWSVPGRYEASKEQAARLAKAILKRMKGE